MPFQYCPALFYNLFVNGEKNVINTLKKAYRLYLIIFHWVCFAVWFCILLCSACRRIAEAQQNFCKNMVYSLRFYYEILTPQQYLEMSVPEYFISFVWYNYILFPKTLLILHPKLIIFAAERKTRETLLLDKPRRNFGWNEMTVYCRSFTFRSAAFWYVLSGCN